MPKCKINSYRKCPFPSTVNRGLNCPEWCEKEEKELLSSQVNKDTVDDIIEWMRNDRQAGHFSIRVVLADRLEKAIKKERDDNKRFLDGIKSILRNPVFQYESIKGNRLNWGRRSMSRSAYSVYREYLDAANEAYELLCRGKLIENLHTDKAEDNAKSVLWENRDIIADCWMRWGFWKKLWICVSKPIVAIGFVLVTYERNKLRKTEAAK